MKEAIILAGGLGTRLSATVRDKQKVMAPVGGRPFLDYILSDLRAKGFLRVVLAVSYRHEQLTQRYGTSYNGIDIAYSVEKEPLGTGGAIRQALSLTESERVAVMNGDTFFDVDYTELYSIAEEKNADIVLGAKEMPDCTRHSTLKIAEDGRVLSFSEKLPNAKGYINGGVYVIKRDILSGIPLDRFSFEREILEKAEAGLYAVKCQGYFIDMGIPEAYFRANTEIPVMLGQNVFKAVFLDRDGVICKEKHHLYKTADLEFIDGVPEALEALREKGFLLYVITNQAGVAKGLYTERDVEILHRFMEDSLRDITHFEGIYYCPYHEEGTVEEYKKFSPDRKPGDGMIQRAVRDAAKKGIIIDLKGSILIGDKLSDIEAGKKAGIGKTVLVRSGHAIDEKASLPDVITDSLYTFTKEEIADVEI